MTSQLQLPPVIYGTSCLGNIYQATPYETKLAIVKACVENAPNGVAVFDTAGKYGAGLALESLGKCLKELGVAKDKVIISNKLAWYQVPLTTPEPTFEKGIWIDLKNDAIQKISYNGIIECFEQGNELLGDYHSQMASVHDPDEYLNAAVDTADEVKRYQDILDAYQALNNLKQQGKVRSIGVGAKNWKSIQRITNDVNLDWVMIANSLTLHSHPKDLLDFVRTLHTKGITIINSAVFNGGFLIGSNFYNYTPVNEKTEKGKLLYDWRKKFFSICSKHQITPAEACFNFGFHIPGVNSVALSTTKPEKVKSNVAMATKQVSQAFWKEMIEEGLMEKEILATL
jgi:D-threo-aldose 1-dehydrogenase